MFQTAFKKLSRLLVTKAAFFLPEPRRIAIERRHRGREQLGKLRRADCTIVSYGKSGRTWLRVMLSRIYQTKYSLSTRSLLSFDNFHRKNPAIPRIFFTHDNYIRDYTGHTDARSDYADRKVVLLVRNPADVAVSQFFQWQHRMKSSKIDLLGFPQRDEALDVFNFVMGAEAGLPRIIDFMNIWARDIDALPDFLMVRYEDLRKEPERVMGRLLEFMGTPATAEEIRDAIDFGSVDNMRKMEQKGSFWLSGGRMKPRDKANPESFKVRRAKVGGYLDYFDDAQAQAIHAMLRDRLSPVFGYGPLAVSEDTRTEDVIASARTLK
jgi:hypothetical protein